MKPRYRYDYDLDGWFNTKDIYWGKSMISLYFGGLPYHIRTKDLINKLKSEIKI